MKPVSNNVSPLPSKIKVPYEQIGMQEIIQENSLLKFKPGMLKDQYLERWCRLTKQSFKVYAGS